MAAPLAPMGRDDTRAARPPSGAPARASAGALVQRTFALWWRDLGRFGVVALLAAVPLLASGALADALAPVSPADVTALGRRAYLPGASIVLGGLVLTAVLAAVAEGAVAHAALAHAAGRRAGVIEMVRRALPRAGTLVVAALLSALAVAAGLVLVLPGLFLAPALALALPAAAAEGLGAAAALARSVALTKGMRLALLGAGLAVALAAAALELCAAVIVVGGLAVRTVLSAPVSNAIALAGLALALAFSTLPLVLPAVAYAAAREREAAPPPPAC